MKVGRLVRMIEQLGEEIQQGKFHNLLGTCFREEDCTRDICHICRAILDLWLHSIPLLLTSLINTYISGIKYFIKGIIYHSMTIARLRSTMKRK